MKIEPIPKAPAFFVLLVGGGPAAGSAFILFAAQLKEMADEWATSGDQRAADIAEATRAFVDKAEVGAVLLTRRVCVFCMVEAEAIYRLGLIGDVPGDPLYIARTWKSKRSS